MLLTADLPVFPHLLIVVLHWSTYALAIAAGYWTAKAKHHAEEQADEWGNKIIIGLIFYEIVLRFQEWEHRVALSDACRRETHNESFKIFHPVCDRYLDEYGPHLLHGETPPFSFWDDILRPMIVHLAIDAVIVGIVAFAVTAWLRANRPKPNATGA